jgi:quinoprotein glucose dehydrogenase
MKLNRSWSALLLPRGAPTLVLVLVAASWPTVALGQYGAADGEWRFYGGDAGSTKYSALDQIDRENVSELEIAWRWQMENFGPQPEYNSRVTPLMVGGVLYTTAGYRRDVAAIDATTGETLWVYRMEESEARTASAPRLNSGRGVAYWSYGTQEQILLITPGYHLVALNAKTGLPVIGFGENGVVDLREGLDRPLVPVDRENDRIGSSSPPIVVGDVVVVGTAFPAGGAPPSEANAPGWVRGYDVWTGELRWVFHTIPQAGEFGEETWEDESLSYTGNGGAWSILSADPELGYVYLPLEDATADYYGGHRLGDNLFSSGILCLDARTGERVWHFQFIHHDIWDYDVPAPPILLDVEVDGREIKAVAQVTKQAFTYVFDRVTGEPVWPIEERPVPQSDVPGERAARTQPFPTKPPAFDLQGYSEDYLIDFTPELRAEALEIVAQLRTGPIYTPPVLIDEAEGGVKGTLTIPQVTGGSNWQGGAVDAENGILFIPSVTAAGIIGLAPGGDRSSMDYIRGQGIRLPGGGGPQGLPLLKPPWGRITAIDLNKGEILWQIPNGDTPDYVREHPALQGIDIPPTGRTERGGTLVTRTLFFAGEGGGLFATGQGSGGNKFRAYDKFTGEIVHEMELPANQTGNPMTYMVDGKQYIVMAIGAAGHPAELVALTLP